MRHMELTFRTMTSRGAWLALPLLVAVACSSNPNDQAHEAYVEALRLSHTGGSVEAQIQQVDRCISIMPSAADCLTMRGNLRMLQDQPREAREDFDKSIGVVRHPYTHFYRAQARCALGDYQGALADLDTAIEGQPWQKSFYPQRALARLALGKVDQARADLERAGAPTGYSGAALLFVEGHPGDSVALLDAMAAQQSEGSQGSEFELPRVLRMLSYAALDRRERVAAEFDHNRVAIAAKRPSSGFEYWLVPRSCANAFLATQASASIGRAREIFAEAARQRAANDSLQTLRDRCPSLNVKVDATDANIAWTRLAHQLTDGMLSESEERCAYGRLNDLVMGDVQAREVFRRYAAPVLAGSARASDHADRWMSSQASLLLRQMKLTEGSNGVKTLPRPATPPLLQPRPFWIASSTAGSFVVELAQTANGAAVKRAAPTQLQVLDEHGLRTASRIAEREECAKTSADEDTCMPVAEYQYSGQALAPFAVAFEPLAHIVPMTLQRRTLSHEEQWKYLAGLFSAPAVPAPAEHEAFSWTPVAGGDWVEQRTWREEYRPDWYRTAVTPTGLRLTDCSLTIQEPLTEFACTHGRGASQFSRHVVYLKQRRIGGHDDAALGASLRYAATVDGTAAYFFVVDWNSVPHVHVAFQLQGSWYEDIVASAQAAD